MSQITTPAPVAYARGRESCHGSSLVAAPTDGAGAEVLRAVPVRADPVTGEAELVQISRQTLTEHVRAATPPESIPPNPAEVARLEMAHAALGRFLAEMVHEFRTPLQAVGGYVDLMAMGIHGPVTEQQRQVLARIHAGVVHLVQLTTRVLDHAKVEAGDVSYALTAVPVGPAMAAAASLMAVQADARRITLSVAPCDDRLAVQADAGKLRQVLLNLLANAVKFTDAGGAVTLTARMSALPAPARAGSVTISVTDTGCGIAADERERVFEPFVQVGRRRARDTGVGLGLAISRDLIRGMEGDLTVESTLGVGSIFTVILPRAV